MDTLIGGYVLESELGHGATGTVYLGRSASDQVVAVKVLASALASDSSFQARFASEAAVMTRLADPHCVAVYGHGTDAGRSWIVMEYVPGSTLRAVLETAGVLTPAQACGVMLGALAGLGRAHEIGLVHRDFKPENVLVATDGNSKLTDFGLTIDRGSETSFRALEGSPAYMSPEQVRAEPAGERSDIYAAGAVLYELVAGHAPYAGSTPLAVMRAHVDAPLPDTTALPPRIGQLVRSALAKDPADRPAGAAEFAAQLRDAADRDLGPGWLAAASIAGIVAGIVGAHASGAISGPDHSPSSKATPRRARTLRREPRDSARGGRPHRRGGHRRGRRRRGSGVGRIESPGTPRDPSRLRRVLAGEAHGADRLESAAARHATEHPHDTEREVRGSEPDLGELRDARR